jgi:hypothetical protein
MEAALKKNGRNFGMPEDRKTSFRINPIIRVSPSNEPRPPLFS